MNLTIKKMTQNDAVDILSWKYEKPYDFYNPILTPDNILELLGKSYFIVTNENKDLVGFFCIGNPAKVVAGHEYGAYKGECVDIGLGMNPELAGRGNGSNFFASILEFVHKHDPETDLRLTVATFNKRAIHLYEKFGFTKEMIFHDDLELMTMKKVVN